MSDHNNHEPLVLKFVDEYVDVKSQRSVRSSVNFQELVRERMEEWTSKQSEMGKQVYNFIIKRLGDDNVFVIPDFLANRNNGNGLRAFNLLVDIIKEHPDVMLDVEYSNDARKFRVVFL